MNPRVVHFYFAFFGTLFIAIDTLKTRTLSHFKQDI